MPKISKERREYLKERAKSAATHKKVEAYKKAHPQAWTNFLRERGLI
jgi:hypothetical protein